MKHLSLLFVLPLAACAASSSIDASDAMPDAPSMDASIRDAGRLDSPRSDVGVDVGSPDAGRVPPFCEPYVYRGCSDSADRWVWNGSDCEEVFDCSGLGDATRNRCLESHVPCGAVPFGCDAIACPFHCGVACDNEPRDSHCDCREEPSFVLIDQERTCADDGEDAWLFTLAPRIETMSTGRDVGVLLDSIPQASETIQIRVFADSDAFQERQRIPFDDGALEVARCGLAVGFCEFPTRGAIEIETFGAGEARIDIGFMFSEGEVRVSPDWFSVRDTRNGCSQLLLRGGAR